MAVCIYNLVLKIISLNSFHYVIIIKHALNLINNQTTLIKNSKCSKITPNGKKDGKVLFIAKKKKKKKMIRSRK